MAVKKEEILPFATAWIDPGIIVRSEISQSGQDKYHMISLYVESNEQNMHKLTNKIETEAWIRGTD